ncbi:MAG: hypothetical protein J6Y89_09685 [Lachnospiraceae bacterium]|nr:hypothetical protein [Lachnospiraceae bacterium]
MSEKAEDRRIRKTKNAIRDVFAELLQTKPLNKITVREITEKQTLTEAHFTSISELDTNTAKITGTGSPRLR